MCDQEQTFRAEIPTCCNTNNIKVVFAPVDEHRSTGFVERLIWTLMLGVMRVDGNNIPYNIASHVAEIKKH